MLLHLKDLCAAEPAPAWQQQGGDSEVLTPSTEKEPEKQLQRNQSPQYSPVLWELAVHSPGLQQCRLPALQVFCCSRCTCSPSGTQSQPLAWPQGCLWHRAGAAHLPGVSCAPGGLPGSQGAPGAFLLSWGSGLSSPSAELGLWAFILGGLRVQGRTLCFQGHLQGWGVKTQ